MQEQEAGKFKLSDVGKKFKKLVKGAVKGVKGAVSDKKKKPASSKKTVVKKPTVAKKSKSKK